MSKANVDPFSTFDELYQYWKKAEQVQTPFTAIILSTEIAGLDKKITNFVIDHKDELTNMSGDVCAVFLATPQKNTGEIFTQYREISYSIAKLLNVTPEKFPSIVFFDNLIRPKQMAIISFSDILGVDPTDDELAKFFRTLFTITQELAITSTENRLQNFQKQITKKWKENKQSGIDFAKIVETTLSLTEIAQNITGSLINIVSKLKAYQS